MGLLGRDAAQIVQIRGIKLAKMGIALFLVLFFKDAGIFALFISGRVISVLGHFIDKEQAQHLDPLIK